MPPAAETPSVAQGGVAAAAAGPAWAARGVDVASAELAGRVQAGLIGVRRLGVVCTRVDAARVLLALAARALGGEKVVALLDARDDGALVCLDAPATYPVATLVVPCLDIPLPAALLAGAGIDVVAYPLVGPAATLPRRADLRSADCYAVRYPLLDAGVDDAGVAAMLGDLAGPPTPGGRIG